MKEKDVINGKELERINDELFSSFDPEDESWIVGGSKTVTTMLSYGPGGVVDHALDYDVVFSEIEQVNQA